MNGRRRRAVLMTLGEAITVDNVTGFYFVFIAILHAFSGLLLLLHLPCHTEKMRFIF